MNSKVKFSFKVVLVLLCIQLSSCSDNDFWLLSITNQCGESIDLYSGPDVHSELMHEGTLTVDESRTYQLDFFTSYFFQIRNSAGTIIDEQFWINADETLTNVVWLTCQ